MRFLPTPALEPNGPTEGSAAWAVALKLLNYNRDGNPKVADKAQKPRALVEQPLSSHDEMSTSELQVLKYILQLKEKHSN